MPTWYRLLYWLVVFVFGLMVQTALLPQIFPIGYVPSVMVPLVVILALYETPRRGLALGLLAGLLADLWGGRLIGMNTVTFGLLGYVVANYQGRIQHDPIFMPGLVGGVSQLAVASVDWLSLRLIGYPIPAQGLIAPLPYWVLFGMLFTPAMGAILGFRPSLRRMGRRH